MCSLYFADPDYSPALRRCKRSFWADGWPAIRRLVLPPRPESR